MVQGGCAQPAPKYEMPGRTAEARKAGFESFCAANKSRGAATPSKSTGSNSYGSWGSTFKNQSNFASLHHC
ncbi:Hypothetical protein NTJ_14539 [Nesidiocoris tenuis]|uniref:Uncharacterized protein n=1 Tax=Nesidiocoris tenuis TaxID=355587 RepID=A0ABN7BBK2_9HEMI|nr:Hypothetical protein NTJ_14539 [Nesidiocoris tenuis]